MLTAQDAFDWVRQRKIATVGALYQGDDEAGTLQLLIRVQETQGEGLKNWIFDLTPTFIAGAQWAQAMGADSKPSAYIATRAQQGDPAAQTATRCGSGAKARVSGRNGQLAPKRQRSR